MAKNHDIIDLEELQIALNYLFAYCRNILEIKKINLNHSLFWEVDREAIYDSYDTPIENSLSLGDLYEDIDMIRELKHDPTLVTAYHFRYFSSIFRYLADTDEWYELPSEEEIR